MNSKPKIYNGQYKKIEKIGFGSFGSVYKVEDINTKKLYAMKKFFLDNLKEKSDLVKSQFDLLKSLEHQNITKVIEYFENKGNIYLITDFYNHNLYNCLKNQKEHIPESIIKNIIQQLLKGISCFHSNKLMHRDIKPDNILIDSLGTIKIADFDLVRKFPENEEINLSPNVVTLYYKAPEILYGSRHYNFKIDIWSIGCTLAELYLNKPIFESKREIECLFKVKDICGSINEEDWPEAVKLPHYYKDSSDTKGTLDTILEENVPNEKGRKMIKWMLRLNPNKRPTCDEALNDEYFKEGIATNEEVIKYFKLNEE